MYFCLKYQTKNVCPRFRQSHLRCNFNLTISRKCHFARAMTFAQVRVLFWTLTAACRQIDGTVLQNFKHFKHVYFRLAFLVNSWKLSFLWRWFAELFFDVIQQQRKIHANFKWEFVMKKNDIKMLILLIRHTCSDKVYIS